MEIKIEPATLHNLKDIQTLECLLVKKENEELNSAFNSEWISGTEGENHFKECITSSDACTLIAYADTVIVGYLIGKAHEKMPYRIHSFIAELESIFILEPYRGKGIGTKLYQVFAQWCKSKGLEKIQVFVSPQNTDGIHFYRNNGFTDYRLVLEADT